MALCKLNFLCLRSGSSCERCSGLAIQWNFERNCTRCHTSIVSHSLDFCSYLPMMKSAEIRSHLKYRWPQGAYLNVKWCSANDTRITTLNVCFFIYWVLVFEVSVGFWRMVMDDRDRKKCSRVGWPDDRRQFHYLSLFSLEFNSDCCWFKARDCFTVRWHYGINTNWSECPAWKRVPR